LIFLLIFLLVLNSFLSKKKKIIEKNPEKEKNYRTKSLQLLEIPTESQIPMKFKKINHDCKKTNETNSSRMIRTRNGFFDMLTNIVSQNEDVFEKFIKVIGDPGKWFFCFLDGSVHDYTVLISTRLLFQLLISKPQILTRFKTTSGFSTLKNLLLPHWNIFQLYQALFGLFLTVDLRKLGLNASQDASTFAKELTQSQNQTSNQNQTFISESLEIILAMFKRTIETIVHSYQNTLKLGDKSYMGPLERPRSTSITQGSKIKALNTWCTENKETLQEVVSLSNFILSTLQDFCNLQPFREHVIKSNFLENYTSVIFPILFEIDQKSMTNEEVPLFDSLFVKPIQGPWMQFLFYLSFDFILSSKNLVGFDLILDSPQNVNPELERQFRIQILTRALEDLRKMIGPKLSPGEVPMTLLNPKTIAVLTRFARHYMEKFYQDSFDRGIELIFEFVEDILLLVLPEDQSQTSQRQFKGTLKKLSQLTTGTKEETIDDLLKIYYIVTLRRLKTANDSKTDRSTLIQKELDHIIQKNQIFNISTNSQDLDYLKYLVYCLFQFLLDPNLSEEVKHTTTHTWKVLFLCRSSDMELFFKTKNKNIDSESLIQGFKFLQDITKKDAFQDFFNEKKNELKEVFDENIQSSLHQIDYQLRKVQNEGNPSSSGNLQKKPVKAKKPKEENFEKEKVILTEFYSTLVKKETHRYASLLRTKKAQNVKTLNSWKNFKDILSQERAIWGSSTDPHLKRWKLDLNEGPLRMRKKLEHNLDFYTHYPNPPLETNILTDYRDPTSHHTPEYTKSKSFQIPQLVIDPHIEKLKGSSGSFSPVLYSPDLEKSIARTFSKIRSEDPSPDEKSSESLKEDSTQQENEDFEEDDEETNFKFDGDRNRNDNYEDEDEEDEENEEREEDEEKREFDDYEHIQSTELNNPSFGKGRANKNYLKSISNQRFFLAPFLHGNEVLKIWNCARVSGLDIFEGILVLTQSNIMIIDHYYLTSELNIVPITGISAEERHFSLLSSKNSKNALPPSSELDHVPQLESIHILPHQEFKEFYNRRFLLRDVALEIFMTTGQSHLIAFFDKKSRDQVENRLQKVATSKSPSSFTSGQILQNLTAKWERREISNFEYLMRLNTLAGRSHNDLTQYPVFPWIIKDYTSQELDITNNQIYRNLSAPMGAQTPERLNDFIRRYQEMEEDPITPAFYYGTHYSSAMTVCLYLIRLEPFTQEFLKLQDNHFDRPDRLFHSIRDAWESASQNNQTDVRELIPEFFYLSEFLSNTNRFDFGIRENDVVINNVILPPWAKGDPQLFVRINRQALESEYVSMNLHNWIDLIFGFKQTGKAAVDAHNVFHYLSYEGKVNIDKITDPVEKIATIGIINNFGQTPAQIFKKAHPQRQPPVYNIRWIPFTLPSYTSQQSQMGAQGFHSLSDTITKIPVPTLQWTPQKLIQSAIPFKEIRAPVGSLLFSGDKFFVYSTSQHPLPSKPHKVFEWNFLDNSLRYASLEKNKPPKIFDSLHFGQITVARLTSEDRVVTGGSDCLVKVWRFQKKNLVHLQTLSGHSKSITTLALSSAFSLIISGSEDKTCIIWDLNKLGYVRTLSGFPDPVTKISINPCNGDIAICSGPMLSVWSINGILLATITRKSLIHTCTFYPSEEDIIFAISESKIHTYCLLHKQDRHENHLGVDTSRITSGDVETETNWILTPVSKPLDYSGNRNFLQKDIKLSKPSKPTAIYLSPEQKRIYVGDSSGKVYAYSFLDSDEKHWIKDSQTETCCECGIKFSVRERKHHCRSCGGIFCANCSKYDIQITTEGKQETMNPSFKHCLNCFKIVSSSSV